MPNSLRTAIFATSAIIGLSSFALAAPPAAGDPTAVHPAATASQAAPTKGLPNKNMEVMIEQRITDMHAKLQITAAQQTQWDQFTGVMRDNARDMDQTFQHRVDTMPTMTAEENMQSYAQVASEHAQDMQKLVPAFQALYASMSDSQKKMADQMFRDNAEHRGQTQPGRAHS